MRTKLGVFIIKTYSYVYPSTESIERMKAVIDQAAEEKIKFARLIAKNPADKSQVIQLVIDSIDINDLEHKLFLANGFNERLSVDLVRKTIELSNY